jgi:hypothetical protein
MHQIVGGVGDVVPALSTVRADDSVEIDVVEERRAGRQTGRGVVGVDLGQGQLVIGRR